MFAPLLDILAALLAALLSLVGAIEENTAATVHASKVEAHASKVEARLAVELPECSGGLMLLDSLGDSTGCDLSPPQLLAAVLPDLSPEAVAECSESGGVPVEVEGLALCWGLDY